MRNKASVTDRAVALRIKRDCLRCAFSIWRMARKCSSKSSGGGLLKEVYWTDDA